MGLAFDECRSSSAGFFMAALISRSQFIRTRTGKARKEGSLPVAQRPTAPAPKDSHLLHRITTKPNPIRFDFENGGIASRINGHPFVSIEQIVRSFVTHSGVGPTTQKGASLGESRSHYLNLHLSQSVALKLLPPSQ